METCLLEMKNIHKRFPGVYVLKGVNLTLNAGEVHAIVGENGAGKSTLINILGGIHPRDEGEILIDGKDAEIDGVLAARRAGISIIHQELVLVPYLSAAENIFINREPTRRGLVDYEAMYADAQRFIDELGLDLRADAPVAGMTVAQQQMVEIVKAVSFNARIIVMDEPTSSLTDREIEALFRNIRLLKQRGIGIIYISHRLNELAEIADRVTVLRDGESVVTRRTDEISSEEIVKYMVGREVTHYYTREFMAPGPAVLEVEGLSSDKVKNVSFSLRAGEILGFSGIVGAGRTEAVKAILGFDRKTGGEIRVNGRPVDIRRPSDAYALGIGFIPENRREESIFPDKSIRFNLVIEVLRRFIRGIRVDAAAEQRITADYMRQLSVKAASDEAYIKNLSGGNQQKVIIARWLATHPRILIMDEPTRGIDVGAKAEIYALMNALVKQGISIIMISSELPEIINMSDRVIVMRDGTVTRELGRGDISQENIMKYAVDI